MEIAASTAVITAVSLLASALPFVSKRLRAHSGTLTLLGGVLLLGVVLVDLVPEMVAHGGILPLLTVTASFALFGGAHLIPTARQASPSFETGHAGSWLSASLALHCFACGLLLCGSYHISEHFAHRVGVGLILHKGIEAFALSALLLQKAASRKEMGIGIGVYTLAFPLGVMIAALVKSEVLEDSAMVIAGIGLGALLGCLVQDVFTPALTQSHMSQRTKTRP